MVKYFDIRFFAKSKEQRFMEAIKHASDPISILEEELKKEKNILVESNNSLCFEQLRDLIGGQVEKYSGILERKTKQGEIIEEEENMLLRLLSIQGKLSKNGHYLKELKNFDALYLRVLVWSSKMELTEEIFSFLSEFSFDKSLKLFYYYFKYYMSHLNIFYPDQIKIKQLFRPSSSLNFTFRNDEREFFLTIPNLASYVQERSLTNPYLITCSLNKQYELGLQENDIIFHALQIKIKILLEKNRNCVVRTVLGAYRIFSYIDIAWLRSEDKFIRIPDIFPLPPDYSFIFKEFIDLFLVEETQPKTHDHILDFIESVIRLEEKMGHRDVYLSLNENTTSVLSILSIVNSVLDGTNDECSLAKSVEDQEVMKKLLKMIYNQISDTSEIHGLAESMVKKIFSKQSKVYYNNDIIEICGEILVIVESDQQPFLQTVFKKIEEGTKDEIRPYILTLNAFVQTKYTRQRRDVAEIARSIAQSNIFEILNAHIEEELVQKKSDKKSIALCVINLFSNLCSQNPTLINILSETQVLKNLYRYTESSDTVPKHMDCIVDILNFFHHISLKEGDVREYVSKNSTREFLIAIFTDEKYCGIMNSKNFSNFWSTLNRYKSNIPTFERHFPNSVIASIMKIALQYQKQKRIDQDIFVGSTLTEVLEDKVKKYTILDEQLALLLRIIEKAKQNFFNLSKQSLMKLLKFLSDQYLLKNALLQLPSQSRLLVSMISDISKSITTKIELNNDSDEQSEMQEDINMLNARQEKDMQEMNDRENVSDKLEENNEMEQKDETKKNMFAKTQKSLKKRVERIKTLISNELSKILPKVKQCLEKIKIANCPRSFYEIFSKQRTITEQTHIELQLYYLIPKLERYFHLMLKIFTKKSEHFIFQQEVKQCLLFLPYIQKIVSGLNVLIITKSLPLLKGATTQTKIIEERNQDKKILTEKQIENQAQKKLQEKWTFFHNIIDHLPKLLFAYLEIKKESFAKVIVKEVIVPFNKIVAKQIQEIQQKQQMKIIDFQFLRYTIKIFLELFCAVGEEEKRPFNHMFMFYLYYSASNQPENLMKNLARILSIVKKSGVQTEKPLHDSLQNRMTMVKRIITQMIKNRIKGLLSSTLQYRHPGEGMIIHYNTPKEKQEQNQIFLYIISRSFQALASFIKGLNLASKCLNQSITNEISDIVFNSIVLFNQFEKIKDRPKLYSNCVKFTPELTKRLDVKKFCMSIEQSKDLIYCWIKENFGQYMHLSLMKAFTFAIDKRYDHLSYEKDDFQPIYKCKQLLKLKFIDVSEELVQVSRELFQDYKIVWPIPGHKWKKIRQQSIQYQKVDLKQHVRKMANIGTFLVFLLNRLSQEQRFEQNDLVFHSGYLKEFLRLVTVIIDNYDIPQPEDKFIDEGDYLVSICNELVEEYEIYIEQMHEYKKTQKKERKKIKKSKAKQKKKVKKNQKRKQNQDFEYPLKNVSKEISINSEKISNQNAGTKNIKKSLQKDKQAVSQKKKQSQLSLAFQQFIISTLKASQKNPFLKCKTLQSLMKIINRHMGIKLFQKETNRLLQLDEEEIIPSLLRARICEIEHEGFFHLLSQFGVNLIDRSEVSVDLELAIKRFFYEQKNHQIPLEKFNNFIESVFQPKMDQLSYLLRIKVKKGQGQGQAQSMQFNDENYKQYKNKDDVLVYLNSGISLDTINYKSGFYRKRRSSQNQHFQEDDAIKSTEYIPDTAMELFIQQIIYNIIRMVMREINSKNRSMVDQYAEKHIKTDVFNISTLIHTLQVLVRESPSLAPFITKFKCKKFINQIMDESPKETADLMKDLECVDGKKDLRFISFLIRAMSPLFVNRVFTLLFQLCLDSTVLYKEKSDQNSYLPFGQYTRIKLLHQFDYYLFHGKHFLKTLTYLNLLTMLLSIKEFSRVCIQSSTLQTTLQNMFLYHLKRIKEKKINEVSLITKKIVIFFLLSPISILNQIGISMQLDKKNKKIVNVHMLLNAQSITEQMIPTQFFHQVKFKKNWPYSGIIQPGQQEDDSLDDSSDSDMSEEGLEAEIDQELGLSSQDDLLNESISSEDDEDDLSEDQNDEDSLDLQNVEEENDEEMGSQIEESESDSADEQQDHDEVIQLRIRSPIAQRLLRSSEDVEQQNNEEQNLEQGYSVDNEDQNLEILDDFQSNIEQTRFRSRYRLLPQNHQMSLYEQFDEIITHDRNDYRNHIYRAEKDQENVLRTMLSLISKPKDPQIIEQKSLLLIFENLSLLQFAEVVEFNHFHKFEGFFWNPPKQENRVITFYDLVRQRERRDLGFDSFPNRGRRNGRILQSIPDLLTIPRFQREDDREQREDEQDEQNQQNQQEQNQEQSENLQIQIQPDILQEAFLDEQRRNRNIQEVLRGANFSLTEFFSYSREVQDDIIANIVGDGIGIVNNLRHEIQLREQRVDEPVNRNQSPIFRIQRDEQEVMQEQSREQQINRQSIQQVPPQNIQIQQERAQQPQLPQNYRKLSQDYTKRLNKDIITLLNRNSKSGKFSEVSDQFINAILSLIYMLNENDQIYFPYTLLASLCVNSINQTKILSTLIGILTLGPSYKEEEFKPDSLPRTKFTVNPNELVTNYQGIGYTFIALKILHILSHLSKSYSISISMLKVHSKPIKHLNMPQTELKDKSFIELLIGLLEYPQISQETVNIHFLLKIINHSTQNYFNCYIAQLMKKKKKQNNDENKKYSVSLCEKSNGLLCRLLENDYVKENSFMVSKIVMRLSMDERNLNHYIVFFRQIIKGLAIQTFSQLEKIVKRSDSLEKIPSYQRIQNSLQESKIVTLMQILYQIIKSLKTTIDTTERERVINEFKKILDCQEIKHLCQLGCDLISNKYVNLHNAQKIHEFIDFFFIVFTILLNNEDEKSQKHNNLKVKISQLGNTVQKKQAKKYKFVENAIDLQNLWQKKICTPQGKIFINTNIRNKFQNQLKGNEKYSDSWFDLPIITVAIQTPFLLDFQNKKCLFKAQLKRIKQKKNYPSLHLYLRRQDVFQQSYNQIIPRKPQQLRGKLKIQFEDQEGEDAGGLSREWFQILSRDMFNPNYALFKKSSTGNTFQPDSKSYVNPEHLSYFKFIGRVMGKALHDGFLLDAYFTPAFYKHILSQPITYEDMQEEDFELYNSLKWILNNSPVEDLLQIYFTYEFDNFGEMQTKQLIEGGDKIKVTEENKIQYVQLMCYAKMATAVQKQLEAFLQGFHELISPKMIKIFDSKELEIMISGLPTIDIQDLKRNTEFVNYNRTDQIVIWLFQVLEQFDMGLRTAFLQFVTGTSRLPSDGFKALQGFNGPQKFNIHKDYNTEHLPRAHTCFNQLDLPPYDSKEALVEKLTLAIIEGKEGFGML